MGLHCPNTTALTQAVQSIADRTAGLSRRIRSVSVFGVGAELARETLGYEKARADLRSAATRMGSEDGRIVVFVDNLDRCEPTGALIILESISIVFSEPCFVFIIAMMKNAVETIIRAEFVDGQTGDGSISSRYLDKIVQLEFHVPRLNAKKAEPLVAALLSDLERPELAPTLLPFVRIMADCEGVRGTPRSVKRYINEFVVRRLIASESASAASAAAPGEDDADSAAVLCLKHCWPGLYAALRDDPEGLVADLRAAQSADDPRLQGRRLDELARLALDDAERASISRGATMRGYLGISLVQQPLSVEERAVRAFRSVEAQGETQVDVPPAVPKPSDDASAASRRFTECRMRLRVEPRQELAEELASVAELHFEELPPHRVGDVAVELGEHGYISEAMRVWRRVEKAGLLERWEYASLYALFLILQAERREDAAAVMARFEDQEPFDSGLLQDRWDLLQRLLGRIPVEQLLRELREQPGRLERVHDVASFLGNCAGKTLRQVAGLALEGLSAFVNARESSDEDRLAAARFIGDALGQGSHEVAIAGAALHWSLYGTTAWNADLLHNLALITWVDIDDGTLAVALWTQAYATGHLDPTMVDRFVQLLMKTEPALALQVFKGEPMPDERVRAADASVAASVWGWDRITQALGAVCEGLSFEGLREAAERKPKR